MSQEIELKLLVDNIKPEQLTALPIIQKYLSGVPVQRTLNNIYFDLPEYELFHRKIALRLRNDGDRWLQTLKTAGDSVGGLHRRGEWEMPVSGPELELERFDIPELNELQSDPEFQKNLQPILETSFKRTFWYLDFKDGSRIEMVLDQGLTSANGTSEPISEIELELIHGNIIHVYRLGRKLSKSIPVRFSSISKAEQGYMLLGLNKPVTSHKRIPLKIKRKITAEQLFVNIMNNSIAHMQKNESAILTQQDRVEGVHQMRVAIRRIRSCLKIFTPLIHTVQSKEFNQRLKQLSGMLGALRDWDVFISETALPLHNENPGHQGIKNLLTQAILRQETLNIAAQKYLSSSVYPVLVLDMLIWIETRHWRKDIKPSEKKALKQAAKKFARKALEKDHKKVIKIGSRFKNLNSDKRHILRKRCKELRYATEFFSDLFSKKKVKSSSEALSRVQDILGIMNDARVLISLLEQLDTKTHPDVHVTVLERTQERNSQQLSEFPEVWRKFRKLPEFWK